MFYSFLQSNISTSHFYSSFKFGKPVIKLTGKMILMCPNPFIWKHSREFYRQFDMAALLCILHLMAYCTDSNSIFQIRNSCRLILNDDEQYILEEKYRLSRMKSKSAFLRKMILYGFVYEVDYSHIRKMNTLLGNISSNLNQITYRINSTNTVYQKDLDDITELMEKIWQLQKSMVSKQPLIKQ